MLKGLLLTAQPLQSAQVARIEESFARMLFEPVSLTCRLDPSLIGGVRVEVKGKVYDGSVQGQLSRILSSLHVEEEEYPHDGI